MMLAQKEFINQLSLWDEPAKNEVPIPDACFQNDRDRLREFIINWFQISAKKQSWYTTGMSRGEELWGHFHEIDIGNDQTLDSREWGKYLNKNKTETGGKSDIMRQLCLDALVEDGD